MSKLSDVFNLEKKIDEELQQRVAGVVAQVVTSIDKASPAIGDLMSGDPVEITITLAPITITVQLKQKK